MKYISKLLVMLIVIIASISCGKESSPLLPTPPVQKPMLDVTIKPSTTVGYGDSVIVSFSSNGKISVNGETSVTTQAAGLSVGSVTFRLLKKDTTVRVSSEGPGGVSVFEQKITVLPITEELFTLTRGGKDVGIWHRVGVYGWGKKPNSSEEGWILDSWVTPDDCLIKTPHYFYLSKRYDMDDLCNPGRRGGYAKWSFYKGPDGRLQLNMYGNLRPTYVYWSGPDTMFLEKEGDGGIIKRNLEKYAPLN